jgi:hypothetical protein
LVVEEADQSVFWLEMLADCNVVSAHKLEALTDEAQQLCAIFPASRRTAKTTR